MYGLFNFEINLKMLAYYIEKVLESFNLFLLSEQVYETPRPYQQLHN